MEGAVDGGFAHPAVSVLLPVHNGARHLRAAIDSVLAQTYEDFELLVIDDCSTDDSVAIVQDYSDERIRLLRNHANLGQVGTMNRGLDEARAEIVARMDQDDVCLPARLERQVEVLRSKPDVVVVGGWIDVVEENYSFMWRQRDEVTDRVDFIARLLTLRVPLFHPAVTFRRSAVLAVGGYDPTVRGCEDFALWLALGMAGGDARVVPETVLLLRMHQSQQSQRSVDVRFADLHRVHRDFVSALAPGAADGLLPRLLIRDPEIWHYSDGSPKSATENLEQVVEGAASRLNLDPGERDRLRTRLAADVAATAIASWRHGLRPFWRTSGPVLVAAIRPLGRLPKAWLLARYCAVFILSPALVAGSSVKAKSSQWLLGRALLQPLRRRLTRIPVVKAIWLKFRGMPDPARPS